MDASRADATEAGVADGAGAAAGSKKRAGAWKPPGPRERGAGLRERLPGPDSGWWLGLVGLAFVAAELLFVSPKMGLSWDETVYVSQVSGHAPAAWFDPARARGVPLIVAPVAWLTASVVALRVYLSVLAGLGLVLALWTWRPLRPAWVLALAGVTFGGLWAAEYYGPQAMPDMWSALGCLIAVGCFLRFVTSHGGRGALAGLGASMVFVTLVRPGDAVYLAAPLLVAGAVCWRRWQPVAAVAAGLVAGGAEWVIEAYARFGGVFSRLHKAGAEQGGFGLHFAFLAIPVADGLAFLMRGVRWDLRPAMTVTVACFMFAQLFAQHLVLDHEVGGTVVYHDDYTKIVAELADHGVRPPCLIKGVQFIPIAFYGACSSAGDPKPGEAVAVLVDVGHQPPAYAAHWRSFRITGTKILKVNAYIR